VADALGATHEEIADATKTAMGPNRRTIGYAKFFSHSHDAVIHVYDEAGNVIETHEQAGKFKEVAGTLATPDHL
jgi:hypothetical protein